MPLPTFYVTGTVSVTNGATTVTGSGTGWGGDVIMAGDLFMDPDQPEIPPQRIASVTDGTHIELAVGWPGTTMAAAAYEIRFVGDIVRSTAQTRRVLEQLGQLAAEDVPFATPAGMAAGDVQEAIEEVFALADSAAAQSDTYTKTEVDGLLTGAIDVGSVDNRLLRSNVPGGNIQPSPAALSDAGVLTGITGLDVAGTAAGPASISLAEDTDNGTSKVTVAAPAALAADVTVTFPASSGTLMLCPAATVDNTVARFDGVGGAVQSSGVTISDTDDVSAPGSIKSSGNGGVGYSTGAGGTVTQATSKSTGVTLNKAAGQITLNGAALAAATTVSFVLTDTAIASGDLLIINHVSGGTPGAYALNAQCGAGSASINVRNITSGSLSETIVIAFAVFKAVTA